MLNYLLYIFFGILPSFLWLMFYLRKDSHPEPKLMILKIFFYGMLSTIPAFFIEVSALWSIKELTLPPFIFSILSIFLGVAFVEEFLKFAIAKESVLKSREFDEPVDAMIYMIVAGLGFAAGENILVLISAGDQMFKESVLLSPVFFSKIFEISILRFWGATLLHALSSALIGFFIGLSYKSANSDLFARFGLLLATTLHGLYNFSIIKIEGSWQFTIPAIILVGLAIFISFGFNRLKNPANDVK